MVWWWYRLPGDDLPAQDSAISNTAKFYVKYAICYGYVHNAVCTIDPVSNIPAASQLHWIHLPGNPFHIVATAEGRDGRGIHVGSGTKTLSWVP